VANVRQNSDKFDDGQVRPSACLVCEAMLPEALDGGLSDTEQRAFDKHVAGCVECANELAEAQRGAAWLSMLKTQAPEPPASLLARILAETTGAQTTGAAAPAQAFAPPPPAFLPEAASGWGERNASASGFSTRLRAWRQNFGQSMGQMFSIENARATFQPRMAMTAAMAFFSIALTLNLTGVRLRDLRASSFTPSALERTVADAGASASRTFQNNRVVYQLESRVSELRSDSDQTPGEPTR
jgi:anti-sigma factor RsiW